jgi:hypothetical protein
MVTPREEHTGPTWAGVRSEFRDTLSPGDRPTFDALAEQHVAGEGVPPVHRLTSGQRRVLELWHAFADSAPLDTPPDAGGFYRPRRTRADRRRFRRLFRGTGSPRCTWPHDTGAGHWLPMSVARAQDAARIARETLEELGAEDSRTALALELADTLGAFAIRDARHDAGPEPVALLADALERTGPPSPHLGAARVDQAAPIGKAPRLV